MTDPFLENGGEEVGEDGMTSEGKSVNDNSGQSKEEGGEIRASKNEDVVGNGANKKRKKKKILPTLASDFKIIHDDFFARSVVAHMSDGEAIAIKGLVFDKLVSTDFEGVKNQFNQKVLHVIADDCLELKKNFVPEQVSHFMIDEQRFNVDKNYEATFYHKNTGEIVYGLKCHSS